ncbi:MAG: acyl-CoA dehydrogenase family protein [Proteobacteria bacterium]|nr:acyl-CoA dehydrogenase family protein [Pseudomonadota bacterium]
MGSTGWTLWDWPFFEPSHQKLADRVLAWNASSSAVHADDDYVAECRGIVRSLGEAGLLDYMVPWPEQDFDLRSICLIRESLTYEHALADALFTMQGMGTLAIQRFGSPLQKDKYLAPCRSGLRIAAFALTEPEAGSDVASMTTEARPDGKTFVLNGEKTLISNAGFADHYIVFARTGEAPGSRGLSAFIVDADTPGLIAGPPIHFIAPHPAAPVSFTDCRIPESALIGARGQGFKVAMAALDVCRPSVGAAAVGLARRAMEICLQRVTTRYVSGKPLADMQSVKMTLADMAADIDMAALAVYRAAWEHDVRRVRGSHAAMYAASIAKLAGSEAAGRVVDKAVQLCGGMGVTQGNLIEELYREARPMRIYEGASEVQKLIIARSLLAEFANKA